MQMRPKNMTIRVEIFNRPLRARMNRTFMCVCVWGAYTHIDLAPEYLQILQPWYAICSDNGIALNAVVL